MNEIIERVARAQCAAHGLDPDYTFREREPGKEIVQWHLYAKMAKAAIKAMREPTEAMWLGWRSVNCQLGVDGMEEFTYFEGDYGNWLACHHNMIDAALADDREKAL